MTGLSLRPAGRGGHGFLGISAAGAMAFSAVVSPSPAVPAPAVVTASAPAVSLLATQAAIMMNGTFTPDVTPEFAAMLLYNYIDPVVAPGYTAVPLRTPESLWPFSGLASLTYNQSTEYGYQLVDYRYHEIAASNAADGRPDTPLLVFGYSQSAFIASLLNETVGKEITAGKQVPPTTFFLVGDTNIPNGGLMSRFNGLGLTPWTPMVFTPTDTGSPTYEVFRQYDPFADFPAYPLNALATANALMGYLLHFTLPVSGNPQWLNPVIKILNLLIDPISLNPESPNYVAPIVSHYQDTTYEFIPTAKLPILDPLRWVGLGKLADAFDPVLRPLIEAGYDRSVSFGVPTPAKWGLGNDLDAAIKQSWQALLHLLDPHQPGHTASTLSAATVPPAIKPAATTSSAAPAEGNPVALQSAVEAVAEIPTASEQPSPSAPQAESPKTTAVQPVSVPAEASALASPGSAASSASVAAIDDLPQIVAAGETGSAGSAGPAPVHPTRGVAGAQAAAHDDGGPAPRGPRRGSR